MTKSITAKSTKFVSASKSVKKPRVVKKKAEEKVELVAQNPEAKPSEETPKGHTLKHSARYVFATGRRKTSVANVRLFEGAGKHMVNKKPFETYFNYSYFQDQALKPFSLTGLETKYHFIAHISGGGAHSQAQALRHGLARALSLASEDLKSILKKNGLLKRDDRKKERKKPGLKRARRAPQWAKR